MKKLLLIPVFLVFFIGWEASSNRINEASAEEIEITTQKNLQIDKFINNIKKINWFKSNWKIYPISNLISQLEKIQNSGYVYKGKVMSAINKQIVQLLIKKLNVTTSAQNEQLANIYADSTKLVQEKWISKTSTISKQASSDKVNKSNKNINDFYSSPEYIEVQKLYKENPEEFVYKYLFSWYWKHINELSSIKYGIFSEIKFSEITKEQIIKALNRKRREYNLTDFIFNEKIATAAKNHSEYLIKNNIQIQNPDDPMPCHIEQIWRSWFTWYDPTKRLNYAWYSGMGLEWVNFIKGNILESIRNLLYVPYHRWLFFSPTNTDIGFCMSEGCLWVVNFWTQIFDADTIISSSNKLRGIYPSNESELFIFDDSTMESPRPFPNWPYRGYMFDIYENKAIELLSISLTDVSAGKNIWIKFDTSTINRKDSSYATVFANTTALEKDHKYKISYKTVDSICPKISYFYTWEKEKINSSVIDKSQWQINCDSEKLNKETIKQNLNLDINSNSVNINTSEYIAGNIFITYEDNIPDFTINDDKNVFILNLNESDQQTLLAQKEIDSSANMPWVYKTKNTYIQVLNKVLNEEFTKQLWNWMSIYNVEWKIIR